MTNMRDLDAELELPMDEDENVGDGAPKKKKVKRKKTKEERASERKVVFWTFFIIFGTTIAFWLWPKLRDNSFDWSTPKSEVNQKETPKSQWKNYIEYKL